MILHLPAIEYTTKHRNNCFHCQVNRVQSNFLFQVETTNSFYFKNKQNIFNVDNNRIFASMLAVFILPFN